MHEIEKLKAEKYKIIGVIQDLQKQTRQIDKQIKELMGNATETHPKTDI
jgi:uncharacterized protein involved in exopolysaccharide biosynthesis